MYYRVNADRPWLNLVKLVDNDNLSLFGIFPRPNYVQIFGKSNKHGVSMFSYG